MGKLDPHLRDRYQKMAKNLKRGLSLRESTLGHWLAVYVLRFRAQRQDRP